MSTEHGSQKPLDEEAEESSSLLSNKAVLLTCSLAVIYIICVVVLMIWCRQRRGSKQRNETDPEQLKLNEDNDVSYIFLCISNYDSKNFFSHIYSRQMMKRIHQNIKN